MTQKEIMKRDNILINYLIENKGRENCKSSKEISVFLTEQGYPTTVANVSSIVMKIINERFSPICSLNTKGYYWAKDKNDILECLNHLKSRVMALQNHIAILENYIIN